MALTIHPTVKDIMLAYGGLDVKTSEYIRAQIAHAGTWGFIEDHKMVHIYYDDTASKQDILNLFAHELTHAGLDAFSKMDEEDFCCHNAALCVRAYDLMKKIRP